MWKNDIFSNKVKSSVKVDLIIIKLKIRYGFFSLRLFGKTFIIWQRFTEIKQLWVGWSKSSTYFNL